MSAYFDQSSFIMQPSLSNYAIPPLHPKENDAWTANKIVMLLDQEDIKRYLEKVKLTGIDS